MAYYGLPGTVGHGVAMARLAKRIVAETTRRNQSIDFVHGHKLTVEGLVARYVSAEIGVPYVCTVRGLTDGRVLRWRPDKRPGYRRLLMGAKTVFLPAPWTKRLLDRYLSHEADEHAGHRYVLLPNIVKTPAGEYRNQLTPVQPGLVMVFRENHGKRKGFPALLKAVAELESNGCRVEVDVLGCRVDGVEAGQVQSAGLQHLVRVLGVFSKSETLRRISTYQGLVLPTRADTFGMVYTEALLAGVPVLYSADTGIDGLLDDLGVGIRVDPNDQQDVTSGLKRFVDCAPELRATLSECLTSGRLDFLLEPAISRTYTECLAKLVVGRGR